MRDVVFGYLFAFGIYLISANLNTTTVIYGETQTIPSKYTTDG